MLRREAAARARELGITVLDARYAEGSSFVQIDQLLACVKDAKQRPDAVLIVTAGSVSELPACRRAAKAGVSLVFLNRAPAFLAELRQAHPELLVTLVAPNQTEIGRIQATQSARLAPTGAFVLLVTGPSHDASALARKEGFLTESGSRFSVHLLEAHWNEDGAYRSVSDWFRIGADRHRELALVACANDPMARGARRALVERARTAGIEGYARVPILGCDGLPDEGQQMVHDGEISATILMPSTTPAAIDALQTFWTRGERPDRLLLPPQSFPALDEIRRV